MNIVKYSAFFISRRRTRKLVRHSPYELVPNISQYTFNNLKILHGVKCILHGVKESRSSELILF